MSRPLVASLLASALLLGAAPAPAGWLVPRNGSEIEARAALVPTDAGVGHAERTAAAGRAEAARPRVTLYMTSWCGYCRKARTLLRELGVAFVEKDIERSAAAREEYREKAGDYTGIPLLDIDGTIVRGYSESRIRELVARLPRPGTAA